MKLTLWVILMTVVFHGVGYADQYMVKMNDKNEVTCSMVVTDEYLEKYANDPSNPLRHGYELRKTMDGLTVLDSKITRVSLESLNKRLVEVESFLGILNNDSK